ncbi:MAG TPA: ABC transporter ATP-binding protein [Vicinamibacterales bacterium]|nr:ABC transporter ATP-binding protein [Vicinamibacterales bacterium]
MIDLQDISRTYNKPGEPPVKALDRVSLRIAAGEFVAIVGPSGSGKSTLMNVMGLLDRPTSGEYRLEGKAMSSLGGRELAGLRNRVIGFVFQAYHLLPRTTAAENVQLPLLYSKRTDFAQRSEAALAAVGLSDRRSHYASELSGGQQQRVAIARAIVNEPLVLLADEPTGNLDAAAARGIIDLFKAQNLRGTTVVLITHDEALAREAHRVVRIRAGTIESDSSTSTLQRSA